MAYRTIVCTGHDGFEQVRGHFEALACHARYFTQLPEWLGSLTTDAVSWFAVVDEDRTVAVAALSPQRARFWGKELRLLGGVRQVLDGRQEHGLPLGAVAIAHPEADLKTTARALLVGYRQAGANWDVLWLDAVREGSPWLGSGFECDMREVESSVPVLDTTMPSSQFWAAASAHLRHGLSTNRRRMDREGRTSAVVEARTPDEVATAFDDFVELEGRGWKRRVGAFVKRPEAADFVRRFFVSAAASRRVSIRSLLIDDRLAASQLSVRVGDSIALVKIAYDETLQHLSPGNLLMADLISKACDDPTVNRIDFGERASWFDRWGTVTSPTYDLIAFNPRSPAGLAAGTVWKALRAVGKRPRYSDSPDDPGVHMH